MSKVLVLIAPGSVIHTVKWVNGLVKRNFVVHLITQHPPVVELDRNVTVHLLPHKGLVGYFLNSLRLHKIVSGLSPDIVSVHYASGYGVLAMLSRIRPYILSVWGSDVYIAPNNSLIHKWLIKQSLTNAYHIASTSLAMAKQTQRLLKEPNRKISITPFGVDMQKFHSTNPVFKTDQITIGTAKALESRYAIDVLIKGFEKAVRTIHRDNVLNCNLRLIIAGDGSQRSKLEELVHTLGLAEKVRFIGRMSNDEVVNVVNLMDIFIVSSHVESFGVAAVEASACERPCIVTNIGGLPEVVKHEETGLIVDSDSPTAISNAILQLIKSPALAQAYGKRARQFVSEIYSEEATLDTMSSVLINYSGR